LSLSRRIFVESKYNFFSVLQRLRAGVVVSGLDGVDGEGKENALFEAHYCYHRFLVKFFFPIQEQDNYVAFI